MAMDRRDVEGREGVQAVANRQQKGKAVKVNQDRVGAPRIQAKRESDEHRLNAAAGGEGLVSKESKQERNERLPYRPNDRSYYPQIINS